MADLNDQNRPVHLANSAIDNASDNGEIAQAVTPERSNLRWLWWLLGLLALSGLAWVLYTHFTDPDIYDPPAPVATAEPTPAAPTPTAPVAPTPTSTAPTEPTTPATDWNNYPIIVNGEGVAADFATIGEDEIFPTHVPLMPVARALGIADGITAIETQPGTIHIADGHNGPIEISVGSDIALVDGNPVTMPAEVLLLDSCYRPAPAADLVCGEQVYVPLAFWGQNVFGIWATFHGGHVTIDDAGGTDMN